MAKKKTLSMKRLFQLAFKWSEQIDKGRRIEPKDKEFRKAIAYNWVASFLSYVWTHKNDDL